MNNNHKIASRRIDEFISVLRLGQDNALKARQLCRVLGITARGQKPSENDERIVRAIANAARKAGNFFASDENGYYVPMTRMQAMPCLQRIEKQARDMMKSAKILRKQIVNEFNGQESMEF